MAREGRWPRRGGSFRTLSLDAELPGADDCYSLVDTIGSAEPAYERVIQGESLKPRLRELPAREREILYLRFFCDETQSRIADRLGISRNRPSGPRPGGEVPLVPVTAPPQPGNAS